MDDKVHLLSQAANVTELWGRVTPARFNDYEVHVNRIKGEYLWHAHADTDDVLMVLSGRLIVQLRDREVELAPGEMFVVPAGVEHRPVAPQETVIMCIEPAGTAPAGD
jgi:mannose-6-phosphate isomerase-like protein (cupin superfamily)